MIHRFSVWLKFAFSLPLIVDDSHRAVPGPRRGTPKVLSECCRRPPPRTHGVKVSIHFTPGLPNPLNGVS